MRLHKGDHGQRSIALASSLRQQLASSHEQLAKEAAARELLEENMKQAFMRGEPRCIWKVEGRDIDLMRSGGDVRACDSPSFGMRIGEAHAACLLPPLTALFQGVCALNIEAMSIMKRGAPPGGVNPVPVVVSGPSSAAPPSQPPQQQQQQRQPSAASSHPPPPTTTAAAGQRPAVVVTRATPTASAAQQQPGGGEAPKPRAYKPVPTVGM